MNKSALVFLFLCLPAVLLSCKDSTKVTELITFSAEYIAGNIRKEAGRSIAACWINNVLVELPAEAPNAAATGLDVKGTELYVCGYEHATTAGSGEWHTPVFWRNGERSVVGGQNAVANAIQLFGDDIYVAGTLQEPLKRAVWWKNGELKSLTAGTNPSEAKGLLVDSLNVYVAGSEVVSEVRRARLWKNGTLVALDDANGMSQAVGVVRQGDDVLVFGSYAPFVYPFTSKAVYWRNGKRIELDLPDGGGAAAVTDIAFWNETMYITGSYYSGLKYEACYWENGSFRKLPADSHAEARGISVFRNRVRVIGNLHHRAGVVWDNGVISLEAGEAIFNRILYK